MTIQLRNPTPDDWPAILRAATASLPWHAEANQEWLRNRMSFDDVARTRRHYVAEESAREVVGYGSIEASGAPGRFRLFVVMDAKLLATVGETLYQRLYEDLLLVNAKVAWAREEARDVALIDFFRWHGFGRETRFTTEDGLEVVTLEQDLIPQRRGAEADT
jgi:L-amino acid N-acyltransferase YncA